MSKPYFPDPLGLREALSPGATAHRLSGTLEQRIAALEQAALARPPAGTPDGSQITSDTSRPGGMGWVGPKWSVLDQRVTRQNIGVTSNRFIAVPGAGMYDSAAAGSTMAAFYVNPARIAASTGGLSVSVKIQGFVSTESAPTSSTLTVALARVTAVGPGTLISIASDTVAASFSVPSSANTGYEGVSSEADLTTAGWYVVRFQHSTGAGQTMAYGYTVMVAVT